MNSATDNFDPYHKWLGIAPKDQPPNHYRLLGIDLFESDPDVISGAAEQRMAYVRSFQSGAHADLCERILDEIVAARVCLLRADLKAAYDGSLRQQMKVTAAPSSDFIPPVGTSTTRRMSSQTWKLQSMILVGVGVAIGSLVVGLILLPGNSKMPPAGQAPKPEIVKAKTVVAAAKTAVPVQTSPTASVPSEAASETSQPPRISDWVALVPLVQRDRDTHEASWRMVGDAAEFGAQKPRAWVSFPLKIEGSYELQTRVTILRSKGTTAIYMPVVGDKKVILDMRGDRGYGGSPTATIRLRGLNPEPKQGISMNVETEYAFCCKVSISKDKVDLEIHRDNEVLFQWSGNVSQVTGQYLLRPGTVELETEYYSVSLYRDLRLRGDLPPRGLPVAESRPSKQDGRIPTLLTSADEAGKTGDWNKAIADASEAIRLDPNAPEGYRLRASAFGKQGDNDKAIADLDRAIKLDPAHPCTYMARAWQLDAKGDLDKAITDFNEGIWLKPTYAEGYLGRAILYEKRGENEKALSDLTRAIRIDTQHVNAYSQRGELYHKLGRKQEAEADTATARRLKARSYQEQWAKHVGVPLEQTNSIGMKLVLIPPGEFQMGATDEEIKHALRDKDDKRWAKSYLDDRVGSSAPRHRVRITKPFYMGMYEVTQAEYQRVTGKNPSHFSANGDGKTVVANQDTSRFPVEQVSGEDAKEFCRGLSELPEEKKAGRTYRLPTEAEWEYACRGGADTRYSFGDDPTALVDHAWIPENAAGQPHPAAQKRPNAWGLYDMHGNVWEWCGDWYHNEYYKRSPLNDPPGPPSGSPVVPNMADSGTSQVLRGGAWSSPNLDWFRCAARSPGNARSAPSKNFGFRVVCCIGDDKNAHESATAGKAEPQQSSAPSQPTPPVPAKEQGAVKAEPEILSNAASKPIDPNRAAAEVVFRLSGEIKLHGDEKMYRGMGELPKGEFSIREIWIKTGRGITDDDLHIIASVQKPEQLDLLVIHYASLITDEGVRHIAGLSGLSFLVINISQVSDVGLEHLTQLRNLKSLAISSSPITNRGMKHLRRHVDLEWLSLWASPVTNDGLKELSDFQKLHSLVINGCRITDAGLEHLKGLKSLREVTAIGTKITEAGVRRFNEVRPDVKVILSKEGDKPAATKEKEIATSPQIDKKQPEGNAAVVGSTSPVAEKARSYQEQWAKRLGVPLEQTNSIGMKLRFIPPGEFLMGSPTNEPDRLKDEYQHRVRITKPFYLGACEVTQAEYERVIGENPSYFSRGGKPPEEIQGLDTGRFPVEQVSWEDAVEFCRRLSALPEEKAAGRIYRLPTEAEWEYACRAGTTGRFCCGDDVTAFGEYAWYEDNSGKMPHPVGEKRPNAWGLHDIQGNLYEWCQDWYDEGYYEKSPIDDPTGPASGHQRVLRGTGWACYAQRCAHRQARPAPMYNALWGFRVVCVQ